ncbi:Homeobox protein SIX1-like [Aphelenchoides fujianensis]|nr:Homeobox protein SIX1-like [Aphelenchoides fujianensis]
MYNPFFAPFPPPFPTHAALRETVPKQHLFVEAQEFTAYQLEQLGLPYVKQMCEEVENCKDLSLLRCLLEKLSQTKFHKTDCVLKAQCVLLCEQNEFKELYKLIEEHPFPIEYHKQLQDIWNAAHYKETEKTRSRDLDPVTRYRVRRKHPFPRTIWDGEGTSYCFKKRDRKILKEAYIRNNMPSQADKQALAQRTQLSITQVSNWFKNQRQRARQAKK